MQAFQHYIYTFYVHSDLQPHLLINVPLQTNGTGWRACGTATRLQAKQSRVRILVGQELHLLINVPL